MDARDQLRRYLEQRREMGERELVLDGMSVEEVMRILGARPTASSSEPRLESPASTREAGPPAVADTADWREVLRAAGSAPRAQSRERAITPPAPPPTTPTPTAPAPTAPAPTSSLSAPDKPEPEEFHASREATAREPASSSVAGSPSQPADAAPGLVVGTPSRDLFGGPLSSIQTVDEIAATVAKCTCCPPQHSAIFHVCGEGWASGDFVCVGHAVEHTEDQSSRPLRGPAGQLVTKIHADINLRRDDDLICNVLNHRP